MTVLSTETDPRRIALIAREDQRAEDERELIRAKTLRSVIGPYEVHSAPLGYVVLRRGVVEQTFATCVEAQFWAAMQEDA